MLTLYETVKYNTIILAKTHKIPVTFNYEVVISICQLKIYTQSACK